MRVQITERHCDVPDEVLERPEELEEAGDWLLEGALRLLSEPAQKEAA